MSESHQRGVWGSWATTPWVLVLPLGAKLLVPLWSYQLVVPWSRLGNMLMSQLKVGPQRRALVALLLSVLSSQKLHVPLRSSFGVLLLGI